MNGQGRRETMKLWILEPRQEVIERQEDNPWEPWYDKGFAFVIRAETERQARELAHKEGGDENKELSQPGAPIFPWLNAKYSTCLTLFAHGDVEVVIRDFHHA